MDTLLARISRVQCPSCGVDMVQPIDPRTMIQDVTKIQCTTGGCEHQYKVWAAPTIKLAAK